MASSFPRSEFTQLLLVGCVQGWHVC